MKLTPMMQQYMECKERQPDAILFFRLGDFYEMFFEDAEVVARELGLTLTARNKTGDGDDIPMAGVPHHAYQGYVAQLIEKGFTVAIAEQLENPADAKGVVKRDIVKIITPGVVLDPDNLVADTPNYVAAVDTLAGKLGKGFGVAFLDVSTGDFQATEVGSFNELISELGRIEAREILVPEYASALGERLQKDLKQTFVRIKPAEVFSAGNLLKRLARGVRLEGHMDVDGYFQKKEEIEGLFDQLKGFVYQAPELVETAASAVLRYIVETQRGVPAHIKSLKPYRSRAFLIIDDATKANLELTETLMGGRRAGSLLSIIDQTVTAMGGRRLRHWLNYPLVEPRDITRRHDAVEEFLKHPALRQDVREALGRVYDLERLCGKVSAATANARDLRALLSTLEAIPQLLDVLQDCESDLLVNLHDKIDPCEALCARIDRAIVEEPPTTLTEGGLFKVGYDEELDEILSLTGDGKDWLLRYEREQRAETGITSLKVKYNKVFGYYIEVTKANLHMVPEDYIRKQTMANAERYFTEELKEMEDRILHAQDNRNTLEYKLFEALRQAIAERLGALMTTASHLADLDVLAGLAELAERRSYKRPEMTEDDALEIEEGRHPVVETTMPAGERFVPNSTMLSNDRRLAIITGPNMAGKSTVIRQVALISLLAQMGSFVPAKRARLGVVDKIFSRVGASDNLARGQSTFMVEMTETAHILNNATARSLVILDEIGRGTATYDGLSIAWAVAEFLHNTLQAKTLFATHYHELTELAEQLDGAHNMSIAVKEWKDDIIFLRKLVEGAANRSYGIQVGRLAGLPEGVVARAKQVLASLEGGEFDVLTGKPAASHRTPQAVQAPHHDEDTPRGMSVQAALAHRTTPDVDVVIVSEAAPVTEQVPERAPERTPDVVIVSEPAPEPEPRRRAEAPPSPQLSLFGGGPSPEERKILEALRALRVDCTTPIQALTLLSEWSGMLRG